ncbi:MAG: hypothetical protein EKK54_11075 [Neisseriaceae bacterium]|nr:MAG: hypothetical protein EKK54_11075 [Neisseriaceae bacterium]
MITQEGFIDYFSGFKRAENLNIELSTNGNNSINKVTFTKYGINWDIDVINEDSRLLLPIVRLNNTELIGRLPHVNICGVVCVHDSEGLLVDTNDLDRAYFLYIEESINLLIDSYEYHFYLQDDTDLYNEYQGYFCRNNDRQILLGDEADLETGDEVAFYVHKNKQIMYVGSLEESVGNTYFIKKFSNELTRQTGVYIKVAHEILPPQNQQDINWDYIKSDIICNDQTITNYIKKRTKKNKDILLLISIPRLNQEFNTILLVQYNASTCKLYYSFPKRHSERYLLQRNGCKMDFDDFKVGVIGCGSVGSEVIYQLVKCGIKNILITDHDSFSIDNIYRHRLDISYLHENKASAIKHDLEKKLPYINVKTCRSDQDKEFLSCNLILLITGNLNHCLNFNNLRKDDNIPVIYGWNDGISTGGHAILVSQYERGLDFLFERNNYEFNYKYSLIQSNQKISKNLVGCGGDFVPFSYHDSCQTANQMVSLVLQFLESKDKQNIRITWFGNNPQNNAATTYYEDYKDKLLVKEMF